MGWVLGSTVKDGEETKLTKGGSFFSFGVLICLFLTLAVTAEAVGKKGKGTDGTDSLVDETWSSGFDFEVYVELLMC